MKSGDKEIISNIKDQDNLTTSPITNKDFI
jgi:hypothetical protein